ncbi:hypothetical protein ACQ859_09070 [Roseateles chitinivorans]|uniref:hypothetical protein n=1 Tax=Roseateles chitinivorans TaxID=2917965 RepID=UPI003D679118
MNKHRLRAVIAAGVLALGAGGFMAGGVLAASAANESPSTAAGTERPKVIALMAAVGDRFTVVKQQRTVGSNVDPHLRIVSSIPDDALNVAVLRGLDRGIEQEEPQAERVLLRWSPSPALAEALDKVKGRERDEELLGAVIEVLRASPGRAQWDRVEVILPRFSPFERPGIVGKLQGIGLYVHGLKRGGDALDEMSGDWTGAAEGTGGEKVVNPHNGTIVRATTYIAPYMYFERVTLDARTLVVLARKSQFDANKFNGQGVEIGNELLEEKLLALAERSAFQSVRGKSSVEVTAPKLSESEPAASGTAR